MRTVLPLSLATAFLVLAVVPVHGQLTVATDATEYQLGDLVTITIHNAGPSAATFVSYPPCTIWETTSDTCVFGCVGLPVVWSFAPGETIVTTYDTGMMPDPPGTYRVGLTGTSPDPGSVTSVVYELQLPVRDDVVSWGGVKAVYRMAGSR